MLGGDSKIICYDKYEVHCIVKSNAHKDLLSPKSGLLILATVSVSEVSISYIVYIFLVGIVWDDYVVCVRNNRSYIQDMKILSWNIRGTGHRGFVQQVHEGSLGIVFVSCFLFFFLNLKKKHKNFDETDFLDDQFLNII